MEIEGFLIDSEVYDISPIESIPNYQFLSLEDILSELKKNYKKNKKLCELIEMHLASLDNMRY